MGMPRRFRAMRNHLATLAHLPFVKWRRIDRDEQLRPQLYQFVRGIAVSKAAVSKKFCRSRNPHKLPRRAAIRSGVNSWRVGRGFEVTRIIKDISIPGAGFCLRSREFSISNYRRRIEEPAAARISSWSDCADDRSQTLRSRG